MPTRLSTYRRLLGYLSPYRAQMTVAYAAMLFASLLNLAVPIQGRTTLVITQRLLTRKRADCILVLERGTHSELLKQAG